MSGLRRRRPRGRQPLHRLRRRGGRRHRRDQVALPVHPARPVGLRLRRWSTSCSTSTGRSWRPTSTRTGSCTSWTARTWSPVRVAPFVDRIDWGEVDEKGNVTPKVYPDKEGDPVHFWPGPAGAKEWTHACYSPKTELLYVPVQDVGATATRRRREFKESIPYWGAGVAVDGDDIAGSSAPSTRAPAQERWRWAGDLPMCSSVLATGGGLVFAGEPSGRVQRAGRRAAVSSCGGSSAEAATTAARRPTASTAAVRRRAERMGRLGRGVPAQDARVVPRQRVVRVRAAAVAVRG